MRQRVRRALGTAAALVAAVVGLSAGPADAHTVRLTAVGPKFSLGWVDTRAHYRAHLLALADRVGPLGPTDAARPVETARDLVALPEDIGLMAAFAGERGAVARSAPDLTTAILGLIAGYAPVDAYYAARFPSLLGRPFPPTRLLATALTDTFLRNGVETFAEIAKRLKAYVVAGATLVQRWRIVCADRATYVPPPTGEPCAQQSQAKVAALRAPDEPDRRYAYEATSPTPSTMALVFAPDGRLIAKTVKAYLTPTELPGQLDLVPGEVSGVQAIPTPLGRIGIVTSKDAWMPDVTAKLDQEDVDLLVQPEFFVNDTIRTTGAWSPDNLEGAGISDVLRHPSIDALVMPQLVGNVFDFSADAQQAVFVKPRGTVRPSTALVGQDPAPGFAAVSPWVVPDPASPGEPMAERRRRLGQAGEALLPGGPPCADPSTPGPCAGGQVEGITSADVDVPDRPRVRRARPRRRGVAPFSANRPLARSSRAQRNVALAARGETVLAAFEQAGRVRVARSADAGARWSRATAMRVQPGGAPQWWPSVAIGPDGTAWVAWQEGGAIWFARSPDGGRTFGAPVRVAKGDARQWKPSIAATGDGRALIAWIDERARFTGDDLPQAGVEAARLTGDTASAPQRLDAAAPVDPNAVTLDNAWAPSVAADPADPARVTVTWLDFRTYDWDVAARESTDGGATFGAEAPVNATPAGTEAIEDTPRAVYADGGPLVAFTDWAIGPDSATTPSRLYDTAVARPAFGGAAPAQTQVDDHGAAHVSTFSPAIAALPSGQGALVAWQDMATGVGRIRLAHVRSGGPSAARRVDDHAATGTNAWRPALAVAGSHAVVAWEDERDGPTQIYVARAATRRLP